MIKYDFIFKRHFNFIFVHFQSKIVRKEKVKVNQIYQKLFKTTSISSLSIFYPKSWGRKKWKWIKMIKYDFLFKDHLNFIFVHLQSQVVHHIAKLLTVDKAVPILKGRSSSSKLAKLRDAKAISNLVRFSNWLEVEGWRP